MRILASSKYEQQQLIDKLSNLFSAATSNEIRMIVTFTLFLIVVKRIIIGFTILIFGSINMGDPFFWEISLFEQFVLAVIIGPIIETLIFHLILIEILLHLFRKAFYRYHFVIIISAALFSFMHYYSVSYLILSFFAGVVFSTAYIVAMKRGMLPFAIVFVIHSFSNLLSFLYLALRNIL